ncbi:MAG TPA: aminopeptidase P N-terminal domain-containing protein [Candidatus Kapabacteria bacterium]|jgi:Xaa-Pro aminopeptidase|nr:aminopeptidase P N-terminal domain-containing protein [Candidatus Kapabacteria bacterium]
MSKIALVLFALLFALPLRAQDLGHEVPVDTLHKYGLYDTDRLPPSFHAGRRALVLDSMQPHSIALFVATPEKVRWNDINYEYHQSPDFYYLTGCLEPESALLLSKDPIRLSNGREVHEVLFVRRRDPAEETWTGRRLGMQGALSVLKLQAAMPVDSLHALLDPLLQSAKIFYYHPGIQPVRDPVLDTALLTAGDILALIQSRYPAIKLSDSIYYSVHALREIKTPDELRLMRRAISISNEAHNAVIHDARPGWYEYQIQAMTESIFTKNGAEYTAYPCIIGSGPNSTILHYETNRRQTKPGDFIEMDMGAEYHGYCADVTRSFPISGTFTPEQRAIYSLVFAAQDSGIRACVPGAQFRSAHWAAVSIITAGLLKLGIIKDSADYKRYFMHGTSHYLGLDVHDVGFYGPLKPGNVLTVEPGIYIAAGSPCDPKWWNIGCRIEDDILVTASGPEILSKNSPRTITSLEKLLARTP